MNYGPQDDDGNDSSPSNSIDTINVRQNKDNDASVVKPIQMTSLFKGGHADLDHKGSG